MLLQTRVHLAWLGLACLGVLRAGAEARLSLRVAAGARAVAAVEGEASAEVALELSGPAAVAVTVSARRHGAAVQSPPLPLRPPEVHFAPTETLTWERDEKPEGAGPLRRAFRVTLAAAGTYSLHYELHGVDVALVDAPPAATIVHVRAKERVQLVPKLQALVVGRPSGEHSVVLPRPQNIVVVPRAAGVAFDPPALAFSRQGTPSARSFRATAGMAAVSAAQKSPDSTVTVTFELRCPEQAAADAGPCDVGQLAPPPQQRVQVRGLTELSVPDEVVVAVGGGGAAFAVELSHSADVLVQLSATALREGRLRFNITSLRFMRDRGPAKLNVLVSAGPSPDPTCTVASPCRYPLDMLISGADRDRFASHKYATTVIVTPLLHITAGSGTFTSYVNVTKRFALTVPPLVGSGEGVPGAAGDGPILKLGLRVEGKSPNAISVDPLTVQISAVTGGTAVFNITGVAVGELRFLMHLSGEVASKYTAPAPVNVQVHNAFWAPDFDFSSFGVGGLDKQLRAIIRRAFLSHMVPASVVANLGIGHVAGILLHGPPGCGKTTVARIIGKMLNTHEPKVVNGPEIMSKYLGESESRMRQLFLDAEQTASSDNRLHLIIFDEIDALVKSRGRGRGDAADQVYDGITNTLLSKMDGIRRVPNVLVIGTTNRKDLLDEALLRPGRFDVQVEIGLPDGAGRLQILEIHTRTMREHGHVAEDLELGSVASMTESFTGAELEGVVKGAAAFAVERTLNSSLDNDGLGPGEVRVTMADFEHAVTEITPMNRGALDAFDALLGGGIIHHGDAYASTLQVLRGAVERARAGAAGKSRWSVRSIGVLIHGVAGAGKSATAAYIGREAAYGHSEVLLAEDLLGERGDGRVETLRDAFGAADDEHESLLLLDDLDGLVEHVSVGDSRSWNSAMVASLRALMRQRPPPGHTRLVVATASSALVREFHQVSEMFDVIVEVPPLRTRGELSAALAEAGPFESGAQLEEAVDHAATRLPLPIKSLLRALDLAPVTESGAVEPAAFAAQLAAAGEQGLLGSSGLRNRYDASAEHQGTVFASTDTILPNRSKTEAEVGGWW